MSTFSSCTKEKRDLSFYVIEEKCRKYVDCRFESEPGHLLSEQVNYSIVTSLENGIVNVQKQFCNL